MKAALLGGLLFFWGLWIPRSIKDFAHLSFSGQPSRIHRLPKTLMREDSLLTFAFMPQPHLLLLIPKKCVKKIWQPRFLM
jgi:hypothetical protein